MDYKSTIEVLYSKNLNLTQRCQISLSIPKIVSVKTRDAKGRASKVNKFTEEELQFTYKHEPLFSKKDYDKLCTNDIAKNLYHHLSNLYYCAYLECMRWYLYRIEVMNSFNYDTQIEKYKKCVRNQNSCPIIKEIKKSELDNINFKEQFINLIRTALANGISDTNFLLYGKKQPKIKDPKNKAGKNIHNVVLNIVYERFLRFLESESRKEKNTILRKKEYQKISLLSHLDKNQLRIIFNYLVSPNKNMIRKMELADFLNCLSGKQIIPRNRIYWLNSKAKGYYFFKKICSNFSIENLNVSVTHRKGRIDSNHRPKHGYKEFDNLLKEIS